MNLKWNVVARAAATMTAVPIAVPCPASDGGTNAQQTADLRGPVRLQPYVEVHRVGP